MLLQLDSRSGRDAADALQKDIFIYNAKVPVVGHGQLDFVLVGIWVILRSSTLMRCFFEVGRGGATLVHNKQK